MEFKVGDIVEILRAHADRDKIGEKRRVINVTPTSVTVQGCKSPWINPTDSLRIVGREEMFYFPTTCSGADVWKWNGYGGTAMYIDECADVSDRTYEQLKEVHEKFKKKNMTKLSSIAKRLLDKDTQTLVKAGFLDTELRLTDRGQSRLMAIVFEANKAALITEATELLAEEKEASK